MAKFNYFEIKAMQFTTTETENGKDVEKTITLDDVVLQISKRVNLPSMRGEKAEEYTISIEDIPTLFGKQVKFPAAAGDDYTERVKAVKTFLEPYLGRNCYAEEVKRKNNKSVLTYLEFIND